MFAKCLAKCLAPSKWSSHVRFFFLLDSVHFSLKIPDLQYLMRAWISESLNLLVLWGLSQFHEDYPPPTSHPSPPSQHRQTDRQVRKLLTAVSGGFIFSLMMPAQGYGYKFYSCPVIPPESLNASTTYWFLELRCITSFQWFLTFAVDRG